MLLPHMSAHENLFLPGLTAEGRPRTHMNFGDVWQHVGIDHAKGGQGEIYATDLDRLARAMWPHHLVGRLQMDWIGADGAVLSRDITHNIVTDLGAIAMLKGAWGNAAGTPAPFIALDQSLAAATLTSTQTSGSSVTAFAVSASGPAGYTGGAPSFQTANAGSTFQANASNTGIKQNNNNTGTVSATVGLDTTFATGIIASFGTGNAEGFAGLVTANTSTNVNVATQTSSKTHTTGDWLIANGSTSDNPTSAPTGIQYSTSQSQVPSGTGIGGRSSVYSYTWGAGVLTAGQYSALWVTTSITAAAGIWYARASLTPQNVSTVAGAILTYTISI